MTPEQTIELAKQAGAARFYPDRQPDNLRCKTVQKRLATQWGYVEAQPRKAVKLTDDDLNAIGCALDFDKWRARAIEQAVWAKLGVEE